MTPETLFQTNPPLIFQEWNRPEFTKARISVTVLRADLIHPWVQGNKWYKLKPFLEKAAMDNRDGFISMGGPYSNHLIALAFAASELKQKSYFFIRGEEHEWKNNPAVLKMKEWGAVLLPVSRSVYREMHQKSEAENTQMAVAENKVWVPLGGSSPVSIRSVADWARQITDEAMFDTVILPAASAGTVSGFSVGLKDGPRLLAVEVLKSNGGLKVESDWLLRASGFRSSVPVEWMDAYHEGGYARISDRLTSFCREVLEERKFPVEPIYSGKAFFAVSDLAGKGYFKEDSRILLIHTGGIFPWNSAILG